ncbi:MAG: hypothetical protein L3J49_00665 [Desulfobulbaceae bacterium]|nr:hypothetical protein [Desulfobulbaceae bacterium]
MMEPTPQTVERPPEELLSLKEVIAMGVGGMVGGGIFSVLVWPLPRPGMPHPLPLRSAG